MKTKNTQSYAAGALTAKLYNTYYTRKDLPSFIECMKDFKYLRVTFRKYYNLLRANKYANPYVLKYEEFDQLNINQTLIGSYEDFALGYADTIKRQ